VVIYTPLVTIEEFPENMTLDTAKKQVRVTQRKGKESMQAHKKRLKNSLRTDHLNEEEKETLEQICEEFCDTFYLDDMLSCTSTVSHEINTRTDSASVNIRPYRLPEKHKKEVSRQIDKMLNEGIIRPSTSQWKAPILVVPKESDTSGKQKLRVVMDYRRLNDLTIGNSVTKHY